MTLNLYVHQQKILDENKPRLLIAHETGTGKTRTALELAKKNNVTPLIIVPKMLREKWRREADAVGVSCTIVSKEQFRKLHDELPASSAVIIDEAHMAFANFKSQTYKSLFAYFKRCKVVYVWALTATAYTSSPWSVYSLARVCGIKMDYMDFRHRFFVERHFGRRTVWEPKKGIESELADVVRSFGSIVRMDECTDVPEQIIIEELVEMSNEQIRWTKSVRAKESNPLARFTKYHQIASGTLLGDEFTPTHTFEAAKNDRVVQLAIENPKMAVFSRYNKHLDLLETMFKEHGIQTLMIRGDTPDRDAVVREAEESDRIVVLINTACSVGYELPSIPLCVFASLSYSFTDWVQARGRFLRINKMKRNVFIILTTKDSADEPVKEALDNKTDFHEAIYAQTKMSTLDLAV